MLNVETTEAWVAAHRGGSIGILELSGAVNDRASPELDGLKRQVESRIRASYSNVSRQELLALPVMAAYDRYYKRFKKTYHVQLQLESIALKGKSLPNVSPLVDACFLTEVETFVLTASHDVAKLEGRILLDVSLEGDRIVQMNGQTKELYPGDMIMRDDRGVCCSIIYGQDNRSPVSTTTSQVLYVAYAPPGVGAEAVATHLHKIEEAVRLFSPGIKEEQRKVFSA